MRILWWLATLATLGVLVLVGIGATSGLLGYDTFVISGGSMRPAIPTGSIVVAERVDPATIEPGDIITFRRPRQPDAPVTHRVVGVEAIGELPAFRTRGDANANADPELVGPGLPISKHVFTVPYAGYVVTFAGTTLGKVLFIGVPLVWLVDPTARTVTIYRSLSDTERLTENDTITAVEVLPGFSSRVSEFFR